MHPLLAYNHCTQERQKTHEKSASRDCDDTGITICAK